MKRIEDKIRRVLFGLLGAGLGAATLVSGACMLFLRQTSLDTYEEMEKQAVETGETILTEEIGAQTKRYAVSCADVIDKQFGQTTLAMQVIAGEIGDMYENPDRYAPAAWPHAHQVTGEGKQMHWLLPEGMAYQGETARELEILGNLEPSFRSISVGNPQILHIFFAGTSGVNIGYDEDYAKKPDVFESRNRDWYVNAEKAGGMTVSDAYADSFRGQQVVTFSMPCYEGNGTFLGVLAVDLLIDDLAEMTEKIQLEFDGYAMLVSRNGSLIAAPGAEKTGGGEHFLGDQSEAIIEKMQKTDAGMETSRIDGKEKYVIYSRIDTVGWDILIIFDRQAFAHAAQTRFQVLDATMVQGQSAISRQMLLTGGLWAAAVLILIAAVFRASGRMAGKISAPVEQLTEDIRKAGEGSLDYVPRIHTGDELETLSHAFETMTVSLQSHIRSLARMSAERERLATELNVATQIQVSMLPCIFPAFPERPDIDIYASMNPAKEVGGDFYDFFLTDKNHLYVVIADVSGKGIPAALFMVVAKTLLKDNLSAGMPLEQVFARVNSQLCENNEAGMFVTVFAGRLDLTDGKFIYVNAGHNPPCILRAGADRQADVEVLRGPSGFVLAGMDGMEYGARETVLEAGDVFFAYTDGVTEAMNEKGELYGENRLLEELRQSGEMTAQELIQSVADSLGAFMEKADQADDITMLSLRYKPGKEEEEGRENQKDFPEEGVLCVDAEKKNLPQVKQFLDREVDRWGVSNKRYAVQLMAEEIFVNIASYAYPEGTGSVQIRVRRGETRLQVVFSDSGVPYNPLENPDPDLTLAAEERPVGGLGIYMVKAYADETEYRYENGKNVFMFAVCRV